MDVASDELRLRQASLLLRIQTEREQFSRLKWMQASRLLAVAQAVEADAKRQVDLHAAANAKRLHEAYGSLRGQVITLRSLAVLTDMEQELAAETARVAALWSQAQAAVADCNETLARAQVAAQRERRKEQHKQAIVERAASAWHRTVAEAEETEFEMQAAETWPACPTTVPAQPASA